MEERQAVKQALRYQHLTQVLLVADSNADLYLRVVELVSSIQVVVMLSSQQSKYYLMIVVGTAFFLSVSCLYPPLPLAAGLSIAVIE